MIRFVAEGPDGRFDGQPEKYGLYDMSMEEPRQLTNFIMRITEDVHVADDLRPRRVFRGTIALLGAEHHFAIDAEDYGNNGKLTAAIYAAAGAKAEMHCKPELLRTAVSAVSGPALRRASTNFGWNSDKTVYMVPGGQITADGFQEADCSAVQVDLSDQEFAKRLGLPPGSAEQLLATKRHLVDDLLRLCPDAKVGYALLAGAALSVLYRFTDGMNRVLLVGRGFVGQRQVIHGQAVPEPLRRLPHRGREGRDQLGQHRQTHPARGLLLPRRHVPGGRLQARTLSAWGRNLAIAGLRRFRGPQPSAERCHGGGNPRDPRPAGLHR